MVWGRSDRRGVTARPDIDALLAAAHRTFGERRQIEARAHDRVTVDGLDYAYDPGLEPPFVLVPECDRCARRDIDQFPLETWTVDGVPIQAQARSTCRECRFLVAPTERNRPVRFTG